MEKKKVAFTVKTLVFVLSLFTLAFSLSYSYFTVTPKNETTEDERSAIVTTDYLDINFTTSKYINNQNLVLIKEDNIASGAEVTSFTIAKKTGRTYKIKYDIYLTDLNIDKLNSADFKWELLQNGTPIYNGNFSKAKTGERFMLTADSILLNTESSASYDLRIWLQETDVDQSGLYKGTFSAKVGVDVVTVARED